MCKIDDLLSSFFATLPGAPDHVQISDNGAQPIYDRAGERWSLELDRWIEATWLNLAALEKLSERERCQRMAMAIEARRRAQPMLAARAEVEQQRADASRQCLTSPNITPSPSIVFHRHCIMRLFAMRRKSLLGGRNWPSMSRAISRNIHTSLSTRGTLTRRFNGDCCKRWAISIRNLTVSRFTVRTLRHHLASGTARRSDSLCVHRSTVQHGQRRVDV